MTAAGVAPLAVNPAHLAVTIFRSGGDSGAGVVTITDGVHAMPALLHDPTLQTSDRSGLSVAVWLVASRRGAPSNPSAGRPPADSGSVTMSLALVETISR